MMINKQVEMISFLLFVDCSQLVENPCYTLVAR